MTVSDVRERYLEFFKTRGHAIIPSAAIVPENDPTTLFTSSGMQPLVPYLLGQTHPGGSRLADSQLSFRAEDIEEVGDNRHTTFFEMLGNWSLGDYFKQEQLPWLFEFLTDAKEGLGLDASKLYVTVFGGDKESSMAADEESVIIWKKLFDGKDIEAKFVELNTEERGSEVGMQGGRIFSYGARKNWWSRAGVPTKMPPGEIGGPDSEVFYDFGTTHDPRFGKECHPNCDCGRFVEIGNSVFMQFVKKADGSFGELPKKNVDFGGGLERLTAATCNNADIFLIDVFDRAREEMEQHAASFQRPSNDEPIPVYKKYSSSPEVTRAYRIVLDHTRAATFMIADGVKPSNSEQGYILRRLIRRAVRFSDFLNLGQGEHGRPLPRIAQSFIDVYSTGKYGYQKLGKELHTILNEIEKEEVQFRKTLANGLRELDKMGDTIDAFLLFTTYGFPIELTAEIAKERGVPLDLNTVAKQMEEHQAKSRTGAAQKFAGGLADHATQTVRYHTVHHLLLKALQIVLGSDVHQRGSNITSERLRIDFSYGQKMTPEQKAEVEKIVNQKIAEALPVIRTDMRKEEAEKLGAEHEFGATYPDMVSVYSVGPLEKAFSIEFCGGPHVSNTNELAGIFKILKEEASSAGVRRIKAVLE
ncbi:alanine--tRNA ligase [Candidatus Parcubacteria bacterium]|nr:alanine--tRNA ligase [Candidatus Parcubacteria bacterium]